MHYQGKNVIMICFVVALKSEAEKLLNSVENLKEITLADKKAFACNIRGVPAVIAICGVGKVSAALTTQLLIDEYHPDFIFNFGTCGGMNGNVEILKYYAVEKCCQFDFDLSELDDVSIGYIQEYDTVFFPAYTENLNFLNKTSLATADRFINSKRDVEIINELGCSIGDMEGGAIAQVCKSNKVPLVMIKGISDVNGSGIAPEQFYRNLKTVANGFPEIIFKAVDIICKK